ncbi:MAG TPA: ribose-5-phosphate isomerase RpiA, partial [Fibrobacteraceae bacterium]|nr:ribose-5-phosphate isomerase RpiA [Fibrobacteraceae bacterium]
MVSLSELKKQAGFQAADLVQDGQRVGLGTGSTAAFMVEHLADRIHKEGLHIEAVSTSWSTTLQCRQLGIPLVNLCDTSSLDIAMDGADEIDPQRNLIKGRGAAHLLEKIVAAMARHYVIIADSSKRVDRLGDKFAVPLEVLSGALSLVTAKVQSLGAQITVRQGSPGKDGPVISDSGNLILDAKFPGISDPAKLALELDQIPGLVG